MFQTIALSAALTFNPCLPVESPPALKRVTIRHSPKGDASPIIAWITVKSGKHREYVQCGEPQLSIPEPELVSIEPDAPAPVFVYTPPEDPQPQYTPTRWEPLYASRRNPPPFYPPPVGVPEPSSIVLMLLGLAACFTARKST